MSKNKRGKGFGLNNPDDRVDDDILVGSMVKSRTLEPAVVIQWADKKAQLSPAEARNHAFGILEAAVAAEIDSAIVRWGTNELQTGTERAVQLLGIFRHWREEGQIPSCTMNLGNGEHIRPKEARRRALNLLANAFNTEIEAMLCSFLLEELKLEPEYMSVAIEEFRKLRGLETDWSVLGTEEPGDG